MKNIQHIAPASRRRDALSHTVTPDAPAFNREWSQQRVNRLATIANQRLEARLMAKVKIIK